MASKKVLGRGLGAFFPEYEDDSGSSTESTPQEKAIEKTILEPSEKVNTVLHVPVEHIRANPHQPRREFDVDALVELADSIKEHGIIQPITVRYLGEKRFELISGERRLRASKMAGLEEIPAYIREADDEQSMSFALIENIQREELNPLEVAMGYNRLLNEFQYTQAEVAQKVGKNRTTVTNFLRLLTLPDFIQIGLKSNQLSAGHARALIVIEDESIQHKIYNKIVKDGLSVRQVEDAVRKLESGVSKASKASTKIKANPFLEEMSSRLRRTLGTKVDVRSKTKGGEIRIEYYSDEDLERIMGMLDSIQ